MTKDIIFPEEIKNNHINNTAIKYLSNSNCPAFEPPNTCKITYKICVKYSESCLRESIKQDLLKELRGE